MTTIAIQPHEETERNDYLAGDSLLRVLKRTKVNNKAIMWHIVIIGTTSTKSSKGLPYSLLQEAELV